MGRLDGDGLVDDVRVEPIRVVAVEWTIGLVVHEVIAQLRATFHAMVHHVVRVGGRAVIQAVGWRELLPLLQAAAGSRGGRRAGSLDSEDAIPLWKLLGSGLVIERFAEGPEYT